MAEEQQSSTQDVEDKEKEVVLTQPEKTVKAKQDTHYDNSTSALHSQSLFSLKNSAVPATASPQSIPYQP